MTPDTCYAVTPSGAPAARLLCVPSGSSLLIPPRSPHLPSLHWPLVWLWSLPNKHPPKIHSFPQPPLTPPKVLIQCSPNCSQSVSNRLTFFLRVISSTLTMKETHSYETSVYNKPTRLNIPEDGILQSESCLCTKLIKHYAVNISRVADQLVFNLGNRLGRAIIFT
jgi:hypothetical protein